MHLRETETAMLRLSFSLWAGKLYSCVICNVLLQYNLIHIRKRSVMMFFMPVEAVLNRLAATIRNKMARKKRTNSLSDQVVEFVLTRTIDELSTLTVEQVANYIDVNRSHLSRSFRAEKNFTLEEFVFKIKIIRAAALLKENPKATIKNISDKMGFCRCDYFIRIFKQYFGTTPAKYRDLINQ